MSRRGYTTKRRSSTEPPECPLHDVPRLDYVAACVDADRRKGRGEKQRRCPQCGRYVWRNLFHKAPS